MLETVQNKRRKKVAKVVKLIPNLRVAEQPRYNQLRVVRNDDEILINNKGVFYLPVSKTIIQPS